MPTLSSHLSRALAATSMAIRGDICILVRVLMSTATRIGAVYNRPMDIPASQVFMCRHRLQVGRIDTLCVSTEVIQIKPIGDCSILPFVKYSMGLLHFATDLDPSVPIRFRPLPNPAWRRKASILLNVLKVRQARVVTNDKAPWMALVQSTLLGCARDNRCWLTTATHAQPAWVRVFIEITRGGILGGHSMSFHRVPRLGSLPARRGTSRDPIIAESPAIPGLLA